MASPVSPQHSPPKWSELTAATLGAVIMVGLIIVLVSYRRMTKCELIEEPSVQSPDDRWVVKSTTKACPAGLLSVTNYDVIVTLSATSAEASVKAGRVPIFESDDSSEPPTTAWASPNELVLKVAGVGAVKISKHEFENVKINYQVPDWLWGNLSTIETDRQRQDRESKELYEGRKMSRDDLRISLETHRAYAEEWMNFRKWVLENASHQGDSVSDTKVPQ